MRARGKVNLEKVRASLSILCPQCGHEITPAELQRIDFDQVLCPACKQPSCREKIEPSHARRDQSAYREVLTMPNDEVLDRLQRIYAAFEAVIDGDLNKFPPKVVANEQGFAMYQDFLGGLNPAQLSNLVHSVVHNIANLEDHLRRWTAEHRRDPKQIEQIVSRSAPLRLIKDLSNNDKHGYPPRNGGHSGKAPKLAEVSRVLKLTTGTAPGSSVGVIFTPTGPKQVGSGGGSSTVVVTATVVDEKGVVLGDLYDIEVEALKVWEQQLRALDILH